MKNAAAVAALAALGHENRLAVYRLLVEAGPSGWPAGVIAERAGLLPSSLTFHVQALQRAGLITQRRMGRQVFYAADYSAMNALLAFLTENCCSGQTCAVNCDPAAGAGKSRKPRRAA